MKIIGPMFFRNRSSSHKASLTVFPNQQPCKGTWKNFLQQGLKESVLLPPRVMAGLPHTNWQWVSHPGTAGYFIGNNSAGDPLILKDVVSTKTVRA